jgi:hypothetical protein
MNFLFNIYNYIINFYFRIELFYKIYSHSFKCKYFNNKIIKISLYDSYNHKYTNLYNYNSIYKLIYSYLFNHNLINIDNQCIFANDFIYIYTYIKNNKIYNVIANTFIESDKLDEIDLIYINSDFIYAVVDNKYDITHYLHDFKSSLYINKIINTADFVYALSRYYNDSINLNKYSELNIMMDNDYNEHIFKEKDILNIIQNAK